MEKKDEHRRPYVGEKPVEEEEEEENEKEEKVQ